MLLGKQVSVIDKLEISDGRGNDSLSSGHLNNSDEYVIIDDR